MNRLPALGATAGAFVVAGVAAKLVESQHKAARRRHLAETTGFGTIHSQAQSVTASDGTRLSVEIDEPDQPVPGRPTLVFLHGWTCDLDTWHFQRQALRGTHRMVFIDLRSHGNSGQANPLSSSLSDLADDLKIVLDRFAPDEPVVLIGHSMGGMTIMQLACDEPKLFGDRIVGVMLMSTSSGRLVRKAPAIARLTPMLRLGGPVLDWGRGFNSRSVMRRWAVGPGASDEAIDMADEMIQRSPTHVIVDFYPNFVNLDVTAGFDDLGRIPVVVLCGTRDMLTPFKHSRRLAEGVPGATLVAVEGAGHMVMFENHDRVTQVLRGLLERI